MSGPSKLRGSSKRSALQWGAGLIAVASTAVLAVHAYLGSYSRFMADDYCSAAESLKFGILRAAWFWYRTWTGRFSANILDAIFGALGPGLTPVVTSIVLLAWLAVLSAVLLLFPRGDSRPEQPLVGFSLAAAILFVTLALAPNVPQSLYWGQGMRSVVPPLIMITFDAAIFLYCRDRAWSRRERLLWMALSFVLAYGAGGFSETYAALQVVALGLAFAIVLLDRKGWVASNDVLFLSAGLLGSLLSLMTVIIAPGNLARAAFFPPPPAMLGLLRIALQSYGLFFSRIFDSPLKIMVIVGVILSGLWAGAHYGIRPTGWRPAIGILILGVILTFSCFPPAAYGESDAPPDRTLLIPTYIVVVTALFVGVSISEPLAKRWKTLPQFSYLAILLVWVAAAMSVAQMLSLRPTYAAYAAAWGRFHAEMISYERAGIASAEISTADMNANNWAGLDVLGDNARFWLNTCVGNYYGVRVISATP